MLALTVSLLLQGYLNFHYDCGASHSPAKSENYDVGAYANVYVVRGHIVLCCHQLSLSCLLAW